MLNTTLEPTVGPFDLPDGTLRFSLDGKEYEVDSTEIFHRLSVICEPLGDEARFPSNFIPSFQKILQSVLSLEKVTYTHAFYVYKLCEKKYEEAKKKFDELSK